MKIRRDRPVFIPALLPLGMFFLLAGAWGCSKSLKSSHGGTDGSQPPDIEAGSDSALADGGAPGTGGVLASGGVLGTGGVLGSGGAPGTGGIPFSGCSLADGQYEAGGVNPANPCQICNPQASTSAWSNREGVACDDGSFCNGTDTCNSGTCSRHAGAPCLDDGLFCNGVETCDEANRRCASSGNPCPDDGNVCNGPESCNEATKQCQHTSLANDCGVLTCGASPSGCFTCGTCSAGLICLQGGCRCTPQVGSASAGNPPPIPAGLKVICLADPNQTVSAPDCPIIKCGTRTYWAFSPTDNTESMGLVGYDETNTAVYQRSLMGARYIYQISVDSTAQTITLIGQGNVSMVIPWTDLWQ